MGKKYKVVYDREGCIGAAACAAADPKNWIMNDDGKADLVGGKKEGDNWIKIYEMDEADWDAVKEGAEACPVAVIKIYDEKGNQLA